MGMSRMQVNWGPFNPWGAGMVVVRFQGTNFKQTSKKREWGELRWFCNNQIMNTRTVVWSNPQTSSDAYSILSSIEWKFSPHRRHAPLVDQDWTIADSVRAHLSSIADVLFPPKLADARVHFRAFVVVLRESGIVEWYFDRIEL